MEKLTSRQLLMISYILGSSSVEDACRKAKVSRACYYIWIKDEVFISELKAKREIILNDSMNQLKSATTKAVGELIKLLNSKQENIRRLAANDVISYVLKFREFEEFEDRLEKLEKIVK